MKRLLILILVQLTVLSIPSELMAEKAPYRWRVERKEMRKEMDSLKLVIRNLENERNNLFQDLKAFNRANADSLANDNTINLGADDFLCGADAAELDRDSLITLWYQQRSLSLFDAEPDDMDDITLTSDIPDSVYIKRLKNMQLLVSLPYNNMIRNHIIYYTTKIAKSKMETILGLAQYYMPIFEEIFDQYDLPLELKAMAVIESALNPFAVSRAGAKGMWQFMYQTGCRYNLTINSFVDERFDPIKAAHAAARYLRDSYVIFGDWTLAIASYNCGAGNVSKALRRAGGGKDFWDVYQYLPRETRGYVPAFFAALYTLSYYKEHDFHPVPSNLPVYTDTLKINRFLHFEQVSHYTGLSVDELRNLNPQYRHDIIPETKDGYILRLPHTATGKFIDYEDSIFAYRDTMYFNASALEKIQKDIPTSKSGGGKIVHVVKQGQSLSYIAQKYGVSLSSLLKWNNLTSKSTLRIGQKIVIYKGGAAPTKSSSSSSTNASSGSSSSSSSKASTTTSGGYVTYTVKSGDNLWDIAKKYPGVSAQNIMDLNGLKSGSKIYPGMKLKIKKQ